MTTETATTYVELLAEIAKLRHKVAELEAERNEIQHDARCLRRDLDAANAELAQLRETPDDAPATVLCPKPWATPGGGLKLMTDPTTGEASIR